MWRAPAVWQGGALVAVGLSLRLWVLIGTQRLSADEAIPGLMARHILLSGELPVFYWGQPYFGALEAYLVAGLFGVLGFQPLLVFAPAVLASLALIPLTWMLGERLGPRPAGMIAALPVAFTPPILARVLVNAGGGFALGCALQLTTILLVIRALHAPSNKFGMLAVAALTGGLAAWVWQPSLVVVPMLLLVMFVYVHQFRSVRGLACLTPVLIGLLPMLVYNAAWNWSTAVALVSKFEQQSSPSDDLLTQAHQLAGTLFVTLGGGEESFGGSNAVQAVGLAAALVLGLPLLLLSVWRDSSIVSRQRLVAGAVLLLASIAAFAAAHGGARYLMGVFLAACALSGALLALLVQRAPHAGRICVAIWLLLCAVPNVSSYTRLAELMAPEQLSQIDQTQSAVQVLEQRGLTVGYADYWAAYPVTYLSAERVIVAPSLPFMYSTRVDRYPTYTMGVDAVDSARHLFVLVDSRCPAQPYLESLHSSGATFRAESVARWMLIWDIRPPAGDDAVTLANLRETIAAQQSC